MKLSSIFIITTDGLSLNTVDTHPIDSVKENPSNFEDDSPYLSGSAGDRANVVLDTHLSGSAVSRANVVLDTIEKLSTVIDDSNVRESKDSTLTPLNLEALQDLNPPGEVNQLETNTEQLVRPNSIDSLISYGSISYEFTSSSSESDDEIDVSLPASPHAYGAPLYSSVS